MEEFYAIQYLEDGIWVTCETEDEQAEIFRNKESADAECEEWKSDTGEHGNYRVVKVSLTVTEVKYDS